MKKYLLLALLFVGISASAQWENVETTDSFGDKTGNFVPMLIAEGKFSNSATTNSKSFIKIIDYTSYVAFYIYEYGSNPASFCSDYMRMKIKKANGSILEHYWNGYTSSNDISLLHDNFKYCGKTVLARTPKKKRQEKLLKKGKTWASKILRSLESGDKISIITQGSSYRFTIE